MEREIKERELTVVEKVRMLNKESECYGIRYQLKIIGGHVILSSSREVEEEDIEVLLKYVEIYQVDVTSGLGNDILVEFKSKKM